MNLQDKIKSICDNHKLSEKIQKEISKICSDSYIQGSNDCDELTKKYYYLTPKNPK